MNVQIEGLPRSDSSSTIQDFMPITQSQSPDGKKNCLDVLSAPFMSMIDEGAISNRSLVHKFGSNSAIGTSYEVVSSSGTYQTPPTVQTLKISSSSANDTAAGSGARTVYVEGVVDGFIHDTEVVTMNGTTAVVLTKQFCRIFRMYVASSGTYATLAAPSHSSTITLENNDGSGDVWALIESSGGLGLGQSLIGAYSVPVGKRAKINFERVLMETNKSMDVLFFKREDANATVPPYGVMRISEGMFSLASDSSFNSRGNIGIIQGPADIGWLAKVSLGTASMDVSFEIELVDDV